MDKWIIVPASRAHNGLINSAGERFRCDNILKALNADKYDGSQALSNYDVIIYQNAYLPNFAAELKEQAFQIWDLCNPIWLNHPLSRIQLMAENVDMVTVSTIDMRHSWSRHFPMTPAHYWDDAHLLKDYPRKQVSATTNPTFVWFGYADNFDAITVQRIVDGSPLIVVSDRPCGIGDYRSWDVSDPWTAFLDADIAVCWPRQYKSENKMVTALAMGLAVASTPEQAWKLRDPNERRKQIEQADLSRYSSHAVVKRIHQIRASHGKRILVSVPNLGWHHKTVSRCLLRIKEDKRFDITITDPTNKPYENNLHHIVKDFCEGDYDFWLNIDADNTPVRNPLDLVYHDLDIVGLPTPVWYVDENKPEDRPYYYNAYDFRPDKDAYGEHYINGGLEEVDAIGSGCMMVSRRVFMNAEMRKGPFLRKHHEDGRVKRGTDLAFCERARENGFSVWVHYDYPCHNFSEIDLRQAIGAFSRA